MNHGTQISVQSIPDGLPSPGTSEEEVQSVF